MTSMKKLGFFIATLLMVFVVLKPTLAYADTEYDYQDENFGYSLSGAEDKYILEAYLGTSTEVTIPAEANGKPVAVSGNLFQNNTIVESLTFSDGVEILTSEDYDGSKYVEFSGTDSIKKVVFQGDVDFAASFSGPLEAIEFDKNYYNAGAYGAYGALTTYANAKALRSFKVNGEMSEYPYFDLYPNLESIEIGTVAKTAKSKLDFEGMKQLKRVVLPTNLDVIPRACFLSCTSLCEVVIPASLTKIDEYAFQNCGISELVFPESLSYIGPYAFRYCNNLTNVTVPAGVELDGGIFASCENLTTAAIYGNMKSAGKIFYDCTALTTVVIGEGNTDIPEYSFYGCSALTNVALPTTLGTIGRGAFYDCSSLADITLPTSLKTIDGYAFSHCTALKSIILPKGLTTIKAQAFDACTSLTKVELPSSLKTIGDYLFYSCTSLKSVNYGCKTKPGGGMFYDCPALYQIIVPKSLVFTDDWYTCGATGSRVTIVCDKGSKAATSAAKYGFLVWPSTETAVEAGAPELLAGAAEQIKIYNDPGITFKSSNKKVLSVDNDGKLRANKAGKAKIKLYKGKKLFKTISYTVVARNYDNALNILYKYYVTPTMSDYEKVIAADTWLCKFCSYDYQNYLRGTIPDISYEAFGVFDRGVAVCDGYAKAFRQIMEHYNIPCYRVVGVANGGGHAWNLVKIGDKWTYVDSTWDDPIYNGGKDGERSTQNYLMISPNDLQRDHSWAIGAYPAASTNKKFDENICHTGIYNAVLNKVNLSVKKGKTTTLKVTETNQKVTFSSSNKKVATVTKDGKIKGIKKGTTTIKITIGDVKIKLDVTVK